MQQIYESNDIVVYQNSHVHAKATPNLMVSFSAWTSQAQGTPFGQKFFDTRRISTVFVTQKYNHWWHSPSTLLALDMIKEVADRSGFGIVCYGSSMGAYGSIHFSRHLEADAAIAIAPQVFANNFSIPEESRWKEERERISFLFDEVDNLRTNSVKKYIFYDNHHKMDALHLMRMTEKRCLNGVLDFTVPHSNHEVARTLLKTQYFKDFIVGAANGLFNINDMQSMCDLAYLGDDKAFLNWIRHSDTRLISAEHRERLASLTQDEVLPSLDFECLYFAAEALLKFGYPQRAMFCSALSVHKYPWYPPPEYLLLKHGNVCRAVFPSK